MKFFKRKNRAFTLMEVLIGLAIFSLVTEALYSSIIMSQRSLNTYTQAMLPKENLRETMAALVRELRAAKNPLIFKEDHSITLNFQHPIYGNIQYAWTDTGDDAGKIIRTNNSNKIVLAYHISLLSFTVPFTDNQIIIQVGDGEGLQLTEKVALRLQTGLF